MTNKEKAKKYHTAVSNYDESSVEQMVCENYIQHNIKVPTGRSAFVSFLPTLKEYGSKIENIRMLEENQHIIMHHKWLNANPFGFNESAAFHIIRFDDNGLIAEHWNVMEEISALNSSGRSLIDGETAINDLEYTERNKATITEWFDVLVHENEEKIVDSVPRFFQDDFHQHNSQLADGAERFCKAIRGKSLFQYYEKQHALFGEGNFVLSIGEGVRSDKKIALYDLFRLKDGKIAEHWNIYQDIPQEGIANDNTMFNFFHCMPVVSSI